ncbi:MAG: hypothetical protein M3Z35_17165 [Nitrospirota bacterium]|nr:hypothetical protein [Nitrospirota bacterium]
MKRKIDEIDESLVSSVNVRLEGTLVVHTPEKAFLVFPPSLLQDEHLFIGRHAEAYARFDLEFYIAARQEVV